MGFVISSATLSEVLTALFVLTYQSSGITMKAYNLLYALIKKTEGKTTKKEALVHHVIHLLAVGTLQVQYISKF